MGSTMIITSLKWRLMHWLRSNKALENILFSVIKITLAFFILLCLFSLIWWIWFDDGGIVILPFQTPPNQEYNGQSLSDLLTHELMKIKEINQRQTVNYALQIERYIIPEFTRQDTTIDYRITQVGTLGHGSISLSVVDFLLSLKRLLPLAKPTTTLSASACNAMAPKWF
jgi:hypothetical protein